MSWSTKIRFNLLNKVSDQFKIIFTLLRIFFVGFFCSISHECVLAHECKPSHYYIDYQVHQAFVDQDKQKSFCRFETDSCVAAQCIGVKFALSFILKQS